MKDLPKVFMWRLERDSNEIAMLDMLGAMLLQFSLVRAHDKSYLKQKLCTEFFTWGERSFSVEIQICDATNEKGPQRDLSIDF